MNGHLVAGMCTTLLWFMQLMEEVHLMEPKYTMAPSFAPLQKAA